MHVTLEGTLDVRTLEATLKTACGASLRAGGSVQVWCTPIEPLRYTSVLVAAPLGYSFLRMPLAHVNYAVMHACSSSSRLAWMAKYDQKISTSRTFNSYLSKFGLRRRDLPYGSLAYFGNDMGREEQWADAIWPGWFRAYAVPGTEVNAKLLDRLYAYIDNAEPFCLRRTGDVETKAALTARGSKESLSYLLFEAGTQDDVGLAAHTKYARIVAAIDRQLSSPQALTLDALALEFQPEDCRLWLTYGSLGIGVEGSELLEAISAKRARLIDALRWPLFADVAASIIQSDHEFPYPVTARRDPAAPAFAGIHSLREYLSNVHAEYPELLVDPFEEAALYR